MTAEQSSYEEFLLDFQATILMASRRLQELAPSNEHLEGKWTANQILGHLIDSAANNHLRFVDAQFSDDLLFRGYEQNNWVSVQNYNDEPWSNLVHLWSLYNQHLIHVVSRIPREQLTMLRRDHTLDLVAWKAVPKDQPVTLEYFIRDYVGHLKHHLEQIWNLEVRSN